MKVKKITLIIALFSLAIFSTNADYTITVTYSATCYDYETECETCYDYSDPSAPPVTYDCNCEDVEKPYSCEKTETYTVPGDALSPEELEKLVEQIESGSEMDVDLTMTEGIPEDINNDNQTAENFLESADDLLDEILQDIEDAENAITGDTQTENGQGAGDPVRIATGDFYTHNVDLSINYVDLVIEISRYYQTNHTSSRSFGRGWSFNYDTRIIYGIKPMANEEVAYLESLESSLTVLYTSTLEKYNNSLVIVRSVLSRAIEIRNEIGNTVSVLENLSNTAPSIFRSEIREDLDNARHKKRFADNFVLRAENTEQNILNSYILVDSIRIKRDIVSSRVNQARKEAEKAHAQMNRNVYTVESGDPPHLYNTGNSSLTLVDMDGTPHAYTIITGPDYDSIVSYPDGSRNYYPGGAQTEANLPNDDSLTILVDGTCVLTKKNGTKYHYSFYGQLVKISDLNENELIFSYTTDRNLSEITDIFNRKIIFNWNNNKISKITGPKSREWHYLYNENGLLESVTDAQGDTIRYVYSGMQITEIIKPDDSSRKYVYTDLNGRSVVDNVTDEEGNREYFKYYEGYTEYINASGIIERNYFNEKNLTTKIEYPDNSFIEMEYDDDNNLIRRIDELGNVNEYSYDDRRNLIQATDALGNYELWTYNEFNKISSYTDKNGNQTNFFYDAHGNLVNIIYPDLSEVRYEYNEKGQLIAKTDQLGNTTLYEYDAYGYVNTIEDAEGNSEYHENDIIGNILVYKDQLGNETNFEYNSDNKVIKTIDSLGFEEVFEYNNRKDLVRIINKQGNETLFEYDKRHLLLRETNVAGEVTEYSYRADGKLIAQNIEGVNHTTYDYDIRGNLSEEKQIETDVVTMFEYDQAGQFIGIIDPNNNRTEYNYNALGFIDWINDAKQNSMFFNYDAQGNIIDITDKNGNITYYEYDNMARRIKEIDPYYNTIEYTYDATDNITQTKDKNSNVKSFKYDTLGRLIVVNDALGYTESTEYDSRGLIIKKTDKRGNSTIYSYDSLGRYIKKQDTLGGIEEYTYDELGNLLTLTNANGNTVSYEYNPISRLVKEIDPYGNVTEYEYNYLGNVIKKRDTLGNEKLYEYDELGRLVKSVDPLGASKRYEYDANSNVINEIDELKRPNYYAYDSQNRVIKETNALGEEISYIYDAEGNLTGEIDAKGDIYSYEYDKLNRIVEETNRLGNKQYYSYDPKGNLIEKIDFNGSTINYENDALGRQNKVLFADASTELYGYDANGNIVFAKNQNKRLEYEYDELNRLIIAKDMGLDKTIHYSYDSAGNRLSLSWLEDKRQIQYTYGKNNELLTIIEPDRKVTHFKYDALGRPAKKVFPNNVVTEIEYDPASRVTAIKNKNKYKQYGYNKDFESIAYVYNDAGERIFDITNKGDITSYIYDDLGRIKQVYYPFKSDKKLNDFEERIDLGIYPEHNNYRKKDKGFSFTIPHIPEWHNFDNKNDKDNMEDWFKELFDERKELFKDLKGYSKEDKIYWNIKPGPGATEFAVQLQIDFETEVLLEETYSKIGHNNFNTKQWMWTEEFSYDVNSNRTAKANGWGKIEYSYNSAHQITEAGNMIYEHDLNGNLIKESLGDRERIYDYNYDDRVVNISSEFESFTKANENIFEHGVTYAYDAFGRRISRVEYKDYKNTRGSKEHNWYKDTQQSYLYDGLGFEILAKIEDEDFSEKPGNRYSWDKKDRFRPISEYIYANGELVSSTYFNEKNYKSRYTGLKDKDYYLQDILGSTMLTTDMHGKVKTSYKYDAFGNIYSKGFKHGYNSWEKTHLGNEYLYNGKRYDPAVGLYDYGFRDYKPQLGRWTTVDPIRSGSTWYVYCGNDPVNFVDLWGLDCKLVISYKTYRIFDLDKDGEYEKNNKEDSVIIIEETIIYKGEFESLDDARKKNDEIIDKELPKDEYGRRDTYNEFTSETGENRRDEKYQTDFDYGLVRDTDYATEVSYKDETWLESEIKCD